MKARRLHAAKLLGWWSNPRLKGRFGKMPQNLLGWWHNSSLGDNFRTQIFKQHKGSRPSNFLFQIARGSGATLSECTFSSKKRTSPKDFLNVDHFKTLRQKEPGTSHIRVLFDKTSTNNQSNFKTRSSSSLFQIARGSGATPRWEYFFLQKARTTRRSQEALHGFTEESTRTTLVPTRQDLKEQDKASRAQPWSARGLVDTGPTGYPARERGDLVQLGFFPCKS